MDGRTQGMAKKVIAVFKNVENTIQKQQEKIEEEKKYLCIREKERNKLLHDWQNRVEKEERNEIIIYFN